MLGEWSREVPRLHRWIGELDDARFAVRAKATAALEKLGESAEPALRRALRGRLSLEQRTRVEQVLTRLEQGRPERLRKLRSLEVLEDIGSPQARKVLQALAGGAPEAPLTREAKVSLERLAKRLPVSP
ncbi:MAG TPA: hypothetical protein VG013_29645 [Gemmataceae bacterium]|nr:hypothetical protein [Gemmataceae bacterium]